MAIPTLLSIAKADLKIASRLVKSTNKFEKHQAAYFTQQAIEKTIKYLIALKTGNQPWGHDIDKLVMQADRYGVTIPDYIRKHATVYTSWEAVTRYYPQKIIRKDSIEKAIYSVAVWHKNLSKHNIK